MKIVFLSQFIFYFNSITKNNGSKERLHIGNKNQKEIFQGSKQGFSLGDEITVAFLS